MSRIILFFSLLIIGHSLYSQGVSINQDNSSPDSSAMLDVKSSNQGVLIPRLTTVQRDGIENPAKGLLIFNLTTQELNSYNGSTWLGFPSGTGASVSMKAETESCKAEILSVDTTSRAERVMQGENNPEQVSVKCPEKLIEKR